MNDTDFLRNETERVRAMADRLCAQLDAALQVAVSNGELLRQHPLELSTSRKEKRDDHSPT